jgi:hypothetical protein
VAGGLGSRLTIVTRKLLAVLLKEDPKFVALALRCYYDLDQKDQLLSPIPE